ncbi:hypothetical protein C8Q77DRAFT_230712 [Trametes polyzona]|nr:hypothetical protein C8Q77DRAFT_230712 [Trametes polyzona]
MPTWDLATTYPGASRPSSRGKPALSHTLSSRRRAAQQLRAAFYEPVDADADHDAAADTPSYPTSDTLFPRRSTSDEDLRDQSVEHGAQEASNQNQKGSAPDAFARRTVRRKKSSFDLRDLFLHGAIHPSSSPSEA